MTAIVPGSLAALARDTRTSLAEAFLSADVVLLFDCSSSMLTCDDGERTRFDVARAELARLQRTMSGRIAVVTFSTDAAFCPSGVPTKADGTTDLARALEFVRVADSTVSYVVISDGEPNDAPRALTVAQSFRSKIDVVYIGPPNGPGQRFLADLAAARGGTYVTADRARELAATVQRVLEAAHE